MFELRDFSVRFGATTALRNATLSIAQGQTLGLVGESGSGKTMLGLSLMGMTPDSAELSGQLCIDGRDMTGASEAAWQEMRARRMAMIFQEPMAALNPLRRVGDTVMEPLRVHEGLGQAAARARAISLFEEVGIPDPKARLRQFPHEMSGGQRQRVLIALALSCNPGLLIADEPTTALDANVSLRIVDLLVRLSRDRGMALVFITHDLAEVARATQDIAVMYAGDVVEQGRTAEVLKSPAHAYTRALLAARPDPAQHGRMPDGTRPRLPTIRDFLPELEGTAPPRVTIRQQPEEVRDQAAAAPLLDARGLTRRYRMPRNSFLQPAPVLTAVDDVSFTIRRGETLGIVGESGSGKSTVARMVMAFDKPDQGEVWFRGENLHGLSRPELRTQRRDFQMVFQDPFGSLDPRRKIGWSVAEPLRAIGEAGNATERVAEALGQVGLPADAAERFPHEFSGGQRQRIAIARAIVTRPALLVADEAVSALDVSVQAQVLNLLMDLQEELGLGILFISHDLAVVASICDTLLVMRQGRALDAGPAAQVLRDPAHDYTRSLLTASGLSQ